MKNFALIGKKLGHSLSPIIHRHLQEIGGIEGSYLRLEVAEENASNIVSSLKTLGFSGVNVTVPYKKTVLSQLDKVSPEAQKIGAINTILFENGISTGFNTDYSGFGAILQHANIDCTNKSAVILGTGGAANAVATYLLDNGVSSLVFTSRSPQQELFGCPVIPYSAITKANIVINSTPLGMHPNIEACPLDQQQLALFETAIDIIYNPKETLFLQYARELGLKTAGGLEMLVGQAVEAHRIWHKQLVSHAIFNDLMTLCEKALV
ncbi:MAG: shikimate dehydrogenase [Brevinema sp.]